MRNLIRATLFLCVILLFSFTVAANTKNTGDFSLTAEEQAYLDDLRLRPITIAYSYDLVNAEFDGSFYGMLEPVLDVLQNELGLNVNTVKRDWRDAFIQIEAGDVDFYGPIAISESRRQQYITVDPFYRSYSKIMTRTDNPVNSMMGLYNHSIGLLEGSVISRTMQAYLGPNGRIVYFPTMEDMIGGLKAAEIDAFATVDNAEYELMANDDIRFEFSIDNFYVDQGLISGREDMRMLVSILNRFMAANPRIADSITPLRRQALLLYSQERLFDEITYLRENYDELIMYADASLYPLCYLEDGKIKGMVLEITEIFEELTGIKISFSTDKEVEGGVSRAVEMLTTGELMAIAGMYYGIDTWGNPAIDFSPLLWLETFRTYSYKDDNQLSGKTLGALSIATDYLGWNNTTGNAPVLYESQHDLLSALKNGETDAVYMGEMGFNYIYSVIKDYSLREVAGISAEVPMHILYGHTNSEFNALFNEAMTLFQVLNPKSAGEWKTQGDKYKSDYIRMRYTQQILTTAVIIIFIIMLTALIYLFIRNLKAHKSTKDQLVDVLDKVHFDELTGIFNRRYMEECFRRIFNAMTRSNGSLTVMMMDVDFFKRYNDTYGHSMGDTCLRLIATAIKNSLEREDDFVTRYGGEEFVVVLPNTGESGARVMANRILENIRACNIAHKKNDAAPYVTISIGVTTGRVDYMHTGGDYIKQADKALYMSKQSGRDRYTFLEFTPEMAAPDKRAR